MWREIFDRIFLYKYRISSKTHLFLSAREGLDFSRARIQNPITVGGVTVNGKTKRPSYQLRRGDKRRVHLS